ncbi:sulfate transporter family-domain-containing protein [Syncephalis plumigaleata]|nr:sulfate transporter family-domain-containing protein [Syncephalis plumigaleata]
MLSTIQRIVPIVGWLPNYNWKRQGIPDLISGLTLATIVVPQSMAYAMLAGLPPVYGLYTSAVPVIIYACLSTSRHMNAGTFALTSLLLGQAVSQYMMSQYKDDKRSLLLLSPLTSLDESDDDSEYIHIALMLSFLVGIVQLIMSLLRIGRYSDRLMPSSFITAFTTASAFHICTSQLRNLFGLVIPDESRTFAGLLHTWRYVLMHWRNIHLPTMLIGVSALILMLLLNQLERKRRLWRQQSSSSLLSSHLSSNAIHRRIGRHLDETTSLLRDSGGISIRRASMISRISEQLVDLPIPDVLLTIVIAILLSSLLNWKEHYGIAVVGHVPTGLPPVSLPFSIFDSWMTIRSLLWPAIIIASIGAVISLSIAKTFAHQFDYTINENQELLATGLASIVGACFSSYLTCGSLTRSAVTATTGGKTQIVSMICVVVVVLSLLWLAPLFYSLPRTVLAAVILLACRSLLQQLQQVQTLWSSDRKAWSIWMITFMSVFLLDVQWGAALGVAASLLLQ